jgi:hypothetical protein
LTTSPFYLRSLPPFLFQCNGIETIFATINKVIVPFWQSCLATAALTG